MYTQLRDYSGDSVYGRGSITPFVGKTIALPASPLAQPAGFTRKKAATILDGSEGKRHNSDMPREHEIKPIDTDLLKEFVASLEDHGFFAKERLTVVINGSQLLENKLEEYLWSFDEMPEIASECVSVFHSYYDLKFLVSPAKLLFEWNGNNYDPTDWYYEKLESSYRGWTEFIKRIRTGSKPTELQAQTLLRESLLRNLVQARMYANLIHEQILDRSPRHSVPVVY